MSQKYVKFKASYNILLNYNCIWLSILGYWVNLIKIQSFLPQQFPISISSSKTSLASGGIEKSASNSTISNTIKSKATSLADCNLNSTCTTSEYQDDEVSASEVNEVETISVSNSPTTKLSDNQGHLARGKFSYQSPKLTEICIRYAMYIFLF